MRLLVLLTFLLASGAPSFGQLKVMHIPADWNKDTSVLFKGKMGEARVMKLADLPTSTDAMHFRLWTEVQAVDIWTNDFMTFHGILSNFTDKCSENDDWHEKDSFISEQAILDTGIAKRVYQRFSDNHIFTIPTQDSIAGWQLGNDGETIILEYTTQSLYTFKDYWTPSFFKDVKEAVLFDKTIKSLDTMLNMHNRWDEFVYSLPKGCYRSGLMTMVFVTKSKKEIRQRERKKERMSHRS